MSEGEIEIEKCKDAVDLLFSKDGEEKRHAFELENLISAYLPFLEDEKNKFIKEYETEEFERLENEMNYPVRYYDEFIPLHEALSETEWVDHSRRVKNNLDFLENEASDDFFWWMEKEKEREEDEKDEEDEDDEDDDEDEDEREEENDYEFLIRNIEKGDKDFLKRFKEAIKSAILEYDVSSYDDYISDDFNSWNRGFPSFTIPTKNGDIEVPYHLDFLLEEKADLIECKLRAEKNNCIRINYLNFILSQLEEIRENSQKLTSKEVLVRIDKKLDLIINAIDYCDGESASNLDLFAKYQKNEDK